MIACLRKLRDYGRLKAVCLIAIAALGPLAIAQNPLDTEASASTFKANCAICHGEDGSGTALGNRFQVKDLRSPEVQEKTTAELAETIRGGKGKMPAFATRLSGEQIEQLIEYIRSKKPK
jgi:mono/diheme cytochrome c family protein